MDDKMMRAIRALAEGDLDRASAIANGADPADDDGFVAVDIHSDMTAFECLGCRDRCCTNIDGPSITPYDWLRIQSYVHSAGWRNLTPAELDDLVLVEPDMLPMMRARMLTNPDETLTACAFLIVVDGWPEGLSRDAYDMRNVGNDWRMLTERRSVGTEETSHTACAINPVRPASCALYPLGRQVAWRNGMTEVSYFITRGANCPGLSAGSRARTWAEVLEERGYDLAASSAAIHQVNRIMRMLPGSNYSPLNFHVARAILYPSMLSGTVLPDTHEAAMAALGHIEVALRDWLDAGAPQTQSGQVLADVQHAILEGKRYEWRNS